MGGGNPGIGGDPGQLVDPQLPSGGSGGQIVSTMLVRGEAPSGEAKKEFSKAVEASGRLSESEIEQQRLPSALQKVAKDYFDRLQGNSSDN